MSKKMSKKKPKFDVSEIELEAKCTLASYRGRKGNSLARQAKVWHIRNYVRKVLFLIKQIEILEKTKGGKK